MIKDATPYFEFMYLVDLSFCGGNKFPEEPKYVVIVLTAGGLQPRIQPSVSAVMLPFLFDSLAPVTDFLDLVNYQDALVILFNMHNGADSAPALTNPLSDSFVSVICAKTKMRHRQIIHELADHRRLANMPCPPR